MLERLNTVPNQLTALRLLLVPILWVFALLRLPFYIGIGLIIACLTDALDGAIARRLNQVSEFGSKLDSLADTFVTPSAVIWLLMFRPEVFVEHPVASLAAIVICAASLLVGLIKFRRLANLHLYSSKAAGLMQYIFIVHAFLFSNYNEWLFFIAIGMWILSSTETLVLQLTRSQVDEHVGSIVLGFLRHDS